MRARVCALTVALLLLGSSGCRDDSDSAPSASAGGGETAHVASPEEICPEHGVLEAVCTKCNPRLIPVFQAKGDWCAEHGFPESFCPICHPERGGRPAADVGGADAPPADRLKVKLASPETARIAGIATEKGRPMTGTDEFSVPVRLVYDAARRAEINARSAGVVSAVHVDQGSRVHKGGALVVVDSPEVGADRARLTAARSAVDVARTQLEREKALFGDGIMTKRDVQQAESNLAAAQAEVVALEASTAVVGGGGGSGRYTLQAPIEGIVVRREATVGRRVDTEDLLLEIVDASVLWAELDVPESRLAEVRVGSPVTLTFEGLVGRTFEGTIASIAPEVDPHTRTASARVKLMNPDGALRANMYGKARIATGRVGSGIAVPVGALQVANGAEVVFVRLTDTLFETRRIETGMRSDGWVEVTRGVTAGEDIVTVGAFLLKTETLKGSIGAGCCEVD